MAETLNSILSVSLLALGFGFVIFWHELGHFLAAKYVGIKVEQFAVGFGQALLAWRKGIGIRVGTTRPEYERRIKEHLGAKERDGGELTDTNNVTTEQIDAATKELGLGETEYRLNWIPLGGYVKMLGQDDMNPNAISEDPRAYPQKSVGARMLVISAGVIMNIILAAIGFMILFTIGFKVAPAVVGNVQPGSPASRVTHVVDGKTVTTSLRVGDEFLEFDGKKQDDWTKVPLTSALADPTEPTSIKVRHPDGTVAEYRTLPERTTSGRGKDFLTMGITPPKSLRGAQVAEDMDKLKGLLPPEYFAMGEGDAIVAVEGKAVDPGEPRSEVKTSDFYILDEAVQAAGRAGGREVNLTVRNAAGETRDLKVKPQYQDFFGGPGSLNFAGMMPRTTVALILDPEMQAAKHLRVNDVVLKIESAGDSEPNPTFKKLTELLTKAGSGGQEVAITVLRGGEEITERVIPKEKTRDGTYILGFAPGVDAEHAVVSGSREGSAAAKAGIPDGATIVSLGGTAVSTWFDVHRILLAAPVNQPIDVVAKKGNQEIKTQIVLTESDRETAQMARFDVPLPLAEHTFLRKAGNPAKAAWWGVVETRDFILQFYVTLQRMFGGSISPKNLMGPVGIFRHGADFAFKGTDWLIWFLAMISANLAVVNFLPIPVVDGGHFVFLLLEKIQGKPVSQRMQSIAQVVGLALLLGVFLLVTYQDIARMISPY